MRGGYAMNGMEWKWENTKSGSKSEWRVTHQRVR